MPRLISGGVIIEDDAPEIVSHDDWLELADKNGLLEQLYDYWILGNEYEAKTPRWSIMRNLLGWGS